jgi:hypothetical protein
MFINSNVNSNSNNTKRNKRKILHKSSNNNNTSTELSTIVNNTKLQEFLYQLLCLGILAVVYKYNIHIIDFLSRYNPITNSKGNNTNNHLNVSVIYYKSFLISFFIITLLVNYIMFIKNSTHSTPSSSGLLLFGSLQFIFIMVIFYKTDKHIYRLDSFLDTQSETTEPKHTTPEHTTPEHTTPQNKDYPNIDSNPDLPSKSKIWKQMRDYKTTELPEYVKDPNAQYNKPEHYDYTPDDIPQWHLDPTLAAKFKEMKDKWEADPNRGYREQVKAKDNQSLPYMEGGLDMIYPDTKVKNLFEMNRKANVPNAVVLNALASGKDPNDSTSHLRKYDSCQLNALTHDNPSKLYFDPNNRYQHLDKFPNPDFEMQVCSPPTLQDKYKDPKINTTNPDLESISNYQTSFMESISKNSEYTYDSDEIYTQYISKNMGELEKNNIRKAKNISQYCSNYPHASSEQLRKVNDNKAYSIFDGK